MLRFQGFCTFPHGQLSIYVFIMSISGYLFALSASWGCNFVYVDATFSKMSGSGGALLTDYSAGFGMFSYEDGADQTDGNFNWMCYTYDDNQLANLDSAFMTARSFAFISNIMIGISMVLLVLTCCMELSSTLIKLIATIMIVGSLCQLLVFMIFGSDLCADYNCSFSWGAAFAICAFLVAIIAGILTCYMPDAVEPFLSEDFSGAAREPFQPGTVTETETIMPDGSTKITRTTVNLDGSKTIEEDIYDPPSEFQDEPQNNSQSYGQQGSDNNNDYQEEPQRNGQSSYGQGPDDVEDRQFD